MNVMDNLFIEIDELNLCIDESNENVKNVKELLILKQIEDDLLTHDFSKPHVTREEIQSILNGINVVNEFHTSKTSNSNKPSNKKEKYINLLNTTRMSIIEFV